MIVTQKNCSKCKMSHPLGDHFYPVGEWDAPKIAEDEKDRCWAQYVVPYLNGSRQVKMGEEYQCKFTHNHYSPHQLPATTLSDGTIWRGEWWYREESGLNDGNYVVDRPKKR